MPGRIGLNRHSGLVVIDVQNAFNDPQWGRRNNPGAEGNIAKLLNGWRQRGLPVFHVRHASASPTGRFRKGEHSFEFKPEAMPHHGEPVYTKSVNSAFIGTSLESDLREQKIDKVVIVGLTTNHCVSTTARMSGNFGFQTFVVEDATATFERPALDGSLRSPEEVHQSALSDLREEFAEIVSTPQLLAALSDIADEVTHESSALHALEAPSAAAQAYIDRITVNLQGREPLEILRGTTRDLAQLLNGEGEEELAKRPAPGKWSAREILAHLADTETVMGFRLRQILSRDGINIPSFDQDRWAEIADYHSIPAQRSLARLGINRDANLEILEKLTSDQMKRYGVHEERGRETVAHLCRMWAGHDLNHFSQLRSMLSPAETSGVTSA